MYIIYAAMVHAGIGETHVNVFLTTLGLPSVSSKTLKKHERKVGPAIEKVAEMGCEDACREEKELQLETGTEMTFEEALEWLDSMGGILI